MKEAAISQTPQISQPQLNSQDFNLVVAAHSYNVLIEKAMSCPCSSASVGAPNVACRNCRGTGWFFIYPNQTVATIQSMNHPSKYTQWSEENRGTASITARYIDRLSYMDRVTVLDGETVFTQTLRTLSFNNNVFAFTVYNAITVLDLFIFIAPDKPVIKLIQDVDFTIQDSYILYIGKYKNKTDISASIRYVHRPQYHVVDVTRDTMINYKGQCVGNDSDPHHFPIHVVARRAHYVLSRKNFQDRQPLFDNTPE